MKKMESVDSVLSSSKKKTAQRPLFSFAKPRVVDTEHTAHEHGVQIDLYKALKASRPLKFRRRLFAKMYWLAACMSSHLNGKSVSVLFTRWDTLGTAARHKRDKDAEAHASESTPANIPSIQGGVSDTTVCAGADRPCSNGPARVDPNPSPSFAADTERTFT